MIKIIKTLIIIFLSLFLVGCSIKNDTIITISEDHKLDYNVLITIDKDILSNMINANIISGEDDIDNYINDNIDGNYLNGFKSEEYSDDKYIGKIYKYSIDNIDKITSSDENIVTISDSITNKLLFYKIDNTYYANFKYNLKAKENYEDIDFSTTFTVNLPSSCVSSNADKILNNGKKLIWNISNGSEKNIKFSFRFRGKKSYISVVCLAFSLVAGFSLVFLILKGGKSV